MGQEKRGEGEAGVKRNESGKREDRDTNKR